MDLENINEAELTDKKLICAPAFELGTYPLKRVKFKFEEGGEVQDETNLSYCRISALVLTDVFNQMMGLVRRAMYEAAHYDRKRYRTEFEKANKEMRGVLDYKLLTKHHKMQSYRRIKEAGLLPHISSYIYDVGMQFISHPLFYTIMINELPLLDNPNLAYRLYDAYYDEMKAWFHQFYDVVRIYANRETEYVFVHSIEGSDREIEMDGEKRQINCGTNIVIVTSGHMMVYEKLIPVFNHTERNCVHDSWYLYAIDVSMDKYVTFVCDNFVLSDDNKYGTLKQHVRRFDFSPRTILNPPEEHLWLKSDEKYRIREPEPRYVVPDSILELVKPYNKEVTVFTADYKPVHADLLIYAR